MKKEKYLVTGAAGFIGSAIVRELISSKKEVYSVVRPGNNLWRLPPASANHQFITLDLKDTASLATELKKIKPRYIFHLATYGVYRDQQDAQKIHDDNVSTTLNLLNLARGLDLTSFINTGSVYEYADLPGAAVESATGKPRNPYDAAKLEATRLATEFAQKHSLPLTTLRLFTTYGFYEDTRRLVSKTILSFLDHQSPTISPQPIRDFVYLKDVVRAYLLAAAKAPKKGEVINIGMGEPHTVGELVNILVDLMKPSSLPQITPQFAPPDDSRCWADIIKAKSLLGYHPQYDLKKGLKETVSWYKSHRSLYSTL